MFRTSTNIAEEDDNAGWGLDIQTNGKIITCGTDENENGKVVRLTINGKLDTTFGINGIRSTDQLDHDNGDGIGCYFFSIQEVDDKIVLAGNRYINKLGVKRYQACMYCLLTNGNADKTISEIGM